MSALPPGREEHRCAAWVHTDIVGKTCEHSGEESLSECEDEGGWTAVEVQRCSRAVSGGDLLRSVRLGPFFSVPGQWRSLMTHSLRGLLNDGDRVVSFVGAPVTEAGTRIGFPPLHVHHVHVRKPERSGAMQPPVGRERASHWFETHGDYSRGDDFGVGARSAAGYATRLPEGHCYVVTSAEQIDLNAEVNDVRVDASGASELSYYLEAAFTLAPDADCKPVSKFWLRRPRSRELPTDVWERYAAPSTDSVTWWSGKMPSSGRLLHAWLHTHRSRFGGLLLLAAGPEVVNCAALGITPADGVDVAPVRNASFARTALAAAARVVCEDDASQPNSVSLRGHGSEGVADGDYDRRGGLSCRDWSFGVGDAWTVVAFSAARFLPHLRVTPQHTELWMFVDLPGVPNSTATSSPDAPDSPFFTDEANVCWAETRLAAPFSRRAAASLALAALLVLVALASSPRHSFLPWAWRTRGQYLRLPCDSGVS